MNCKHCGADSVVLKTRGRERVRECENKHRWKTMELLQGFTLTPVPATREGVIELRGQGKGIRQIAEILLMSTATVQQHLKPALLESVWK